MKPVAGARVRMEHLELSCFECAREAEMLGAVVEEATLGSDLQAGDLYFAGPWTHNGNPRPPTDRPATILSVRQLGESEWGLRALARHAHDGQCVVATRLTILSEPQS
jgi:hypothetical protein